MKTPTNLRDKMRFPKTFSHGLVRQAELTLTHCVSEGETYWWLIVNREPCCAMGHHDDPTEAFRHGMDLARALDDVLSSPHKMRVP